MRSSEDREVLVSDGLTERQAVSGQEAPVLWSRAKVPNLWMNDQIVREEEERTKGEELEKSKDMRNPPPGVAGLNVRFLLEPLSGLKQAHAEFGSDQSSGSGSLGTAGTPLTSFTLFRRSRRPRARGSLMAECFLAAGVKDGAEKHGVALK